VVPHTPPTADGIASYQPMLDTFGTANSGMLVPHRPPTDGIANHQPMLDTLDTSGIASSNHYKHMLQPLTKHCKHYARTCPWQVCLALSHDI
jgi:hypothetical protein